MQAVRYKMITLYWLTIIILVLRSVHGFADTDLPTLISDLRKEEDHLCAHRGLVPGTMDQTFVLSLTQSFRSLYDKLMMRRDNVRTCSLLRPSCTTLVVWL